MALTQMARDARRLEEIVRTLAKFGLADQMGERLPEWLRKHLSSKDGRPLAETSRPERVRLALTELGTTFIKMSGRLDCLILGGSAPCKHFSTRALRRSSCASSVIG